jgi:hypothetical protein
MVVIHYKKSESNQFRYETSVQILVEDLIAKLSESKCYSGYCLINSLL